MKNRRLFLVLTIMLYITLTACTSVEESQMIVSSTSSGTTSSSAGSSLITSDGGTKHIKKRLSEKILVDADIVLLNGGNPSKADVLTAKYHNASITSLLKTFFSTKKIKQHIIQNGDNYQATDGSYLNNFLGSFGFSEYSKPNINYAFFTDPEDINDYNADKFSTTAGLSFETIKSAANKIVKMLSTFGVDIGENYTCYSLNHQSLQSQQDAYVKRQESDSNSAKLFKADLNAGRIKLQKTWIRDDDCYYFILYPEICGIPVTRQLHGSADNGTEVAGTDITVLYNKNGIVDLRANYLYDKTGVTVKGATLINTDKVLEAIKSKYGSVILSTPITITKMSLQYVPVLINKSRKDFKLTPAWVCNIKQVYEKQNKQTGKLISHAVDSEVLIDAITSKEIS